MAKLFKNVQKDLYSKFSYCDPHTARKLWVQKFGGERKIPEYFYYIPHIAKIFWNCYSKYSYYDPYIARIL